jgi:hypothetical protein
MIVELKHPSRIRIARLIALIVLIPVAAFLIIEIARLIHAWRTVENVARTTARYAVTLSYDDSYCPESSPGKHECRTEAEEEAARLASIRALAYQVASGLEYDNTGTVPRNQPTYFRVIVCGSHPGIVWDDGSTSGASPSCLPYEHPGDQSAPVIIYVEFNHPLITPFRTIASWVPLVAQREMIVERMGPVRLQGLPPTVAIPSPTPAYTNSPMSPP